MLCKAILNERFASRGLLLLRHLPSWNAPDLAFYQASLLQESAIHVFYVLTSYSEVCFQLPFKHSIEQLPAWSNFFLIVFWYSKLSIFYTLGSHLPYSVRWGMNCCIFKCFQCEVKFQLYVHRTN